MGNWPLTPAISDEIGPIVSGENGILNKEYSKLDVLDVDLNNPISEKNKSYFFGSDNPSADITNTPYSSGPFYGYRQVLFGKGVAGVPHLLTVVLVETYPAAGRIWANSLEVSTVHWYGWHSTN